MASNRHSSARVALVFCLLLAIGELHACRPAFAPQPPEKAVVVQKGVKWVRESMSVDDGIAEREPPASRTLIDDGPAKGAISQPRRKLMAPVVNKPVPPTPGDPSKPGGCC